MALEEKIKADLDDLIAGMQNELGYVIFPFCELSRVVHEEKSQQDDCSNTSNIRILYKNSKDTTLASVFYITQINSNVFASYFLYDAESKEHIRSGTGKMEVEELSRLVYGTLESYLTKGCTDIREILAVRKKYKIKKSV